jgi:hypothetical protein
MKMSKVIRIPHNWRPRNVWRYLEKGGKRAPSASGIAEQARMTSACIGQPAA